MRQKRISHSRAHLNVVVQPSPHNDGAIIVFCATHTGLTGLNCVFACGFNLFSFIMMIYKPNVINSMPNSEYRINVVEEKDKTGLLLSVCVCVCL